MSEQACPCRSGRPYPQCCSPYLAGEKHAPTAEALMRSRFCAFCESQIDYLLRTHHQPHLTSAQQRNARTGLLRTCAQTRWCHLCILKSSGGQAGDHEGKVEFVAAYFVPTLTKAKVIQQLHERSRFTRIDEQWYYVDGEILTPWHPKSGQPCWCGSGEKYKRCHALLDG